MSVSSNDSTKQHKSKGGVRSGTRGPTAGASRGKNQLGRRGEEAAASLLQRQGYTILDRNFRCPWGEADIVALDGACLVFVEVRTRRTTTFGTPQESVTSKKQIHLISTAETYIQTHEGLPDHWRIDLISVYSDKQGNVRELEHLENAVSRL